MKMLRTMPEKQQFRNHYALLPDDQLQIVALRDDLLPEARVAVGEELQARGLTDLEGFRRRMEADRAIARAADATAYERRQRVNDRIFVAMIVFMAWLGAILVPIRMAVEPHASNLLEMALLFGAAFAWSCYLGVRARRKGARWAFYLMTALPIVFLATSMIAALVIALS